MMDTGEHVHDLIGAYVLEAVTAEEARMVEQHLRTCDECQELERDLREVEALLPALAGEMMPSAQLKARLMDIVAMEARADQEAPAIPEAQPQRLSMVRDRADDELAEPISRAHGRATPWAGNRRRLVAMIGGLAALLIVAVGLWRATIIQSPKPTTVYALRGTTAQPSIDGTLAYYASGSRLTLTVHGLRAVPSGKVYELWLIRGNFAVVAPAGTFRPDAAGTAQLTITMSHVSTYNLAGVTVEKAPRSTTPHLPIMATATLTG